MRASFNPPQSVDVFFAQQALIPPGQLHEVGYAQLEHDPIGTVQEIYEALALPPFDVVQPALRRYVGSAHETEKIVR